MSERQKQHEEKVKEFAVYIDDFACSAWNRGGGDGDKSPIVFSSQVLMDDKALGDGRFAWASVAPIGERLIEIAGQTRFGSAKPYGLYEMLATSPSSSGNTKSLGNTELLENYIAALAGACIRKARLREAEVREKHLRVAIPWFEAGHEKTLKEAVKRVASALGFKEGTLEDAHQLTIDSWATQYGDSRACICVWRSGISTSFFRDRELRRAQEGGKTGRAFFKIEGWEWENREWDQFAIRETARGRHWRKMAAVEGGADPIPQLRSDYEWSLNAEPEGLVEKLDAALNAALKNRLGQPPSTLLKDTCDEEEGLGVHEYLLIGGLAGSGKVKDRLHGNPEKGLHKWVKGAGGIDPKGILIARDVFHIGDGKEGNGGRSPAASNEAADLDQQSGRFEEGATSGNEGKEPPPKKDKNGASLVAIEVELPCPAELKNDRKFTIRTNSRIVEILRSKDATSRVIKFEMTHPSPLKVDVKMEVAEADKHYDTLVDIGLTPDGAVEIKCSARGHFCPLTLAKESPKGATLELRAGGVYRLILGKEHEDYCRTIQRLRHLVAVGLHILPEPGSEPDGES